MAAEAAVEGVGVLLEPGLAEGDRSVVVEVEEVDGDDTTTPRTAAAVTVWIRAC